MHIFALCMPNKVLNMQQNYINGMQLVYMSTCNMNKFHVNIVKLHEYACWNSFSHAHTIFFVLNIGIIEVCHHKIILYSLNLYKKTTWKLNNEFKEWKSHINYRCNNGYHNSQKKRSCINSVIDCKLCIIYVNQRKW